MAAHLTDKMTDHVTVAGKMNDDKFQRITVACKWLEREAGLQCTLLSLLPTDYDVWTAKALDKTGITHKSNVVVLLGQPATYLGGETEFLAWASEKYGYDDSKTNAIFFKRAAKRAWDNYMLESGRQFAKITLTQDETVLGSLLIEIFSDHCPKTAEHFVKLIVGNRDKGDMSYESSPVHRVVPGGWMQSGDVVNGDGDGDPGYSFPDETFKIRHDKPGIIGCANKWNTPHTNNSHFYITFAPLSFLDGKKVAFARVIDGLRVLRLVEKTKLRFERPTATIRISSCELLSSPAAQP